MGARRCPAPPALRAAAPHGPQPGWLAGWAARVAWKPLITPATPARTTPVSLIPGRALPRLLQPSSMLLDDLLAAHLPTSKAPRLHALLLSSGGRQKPATPCCQVARCHCRAAAAWAERTRGQWRHGTGGRQQRSLVCLGAPASRVQPGRLSGPARFMHPACMARAPARNLIPRITTHQAPTLRRPAAVQRAAPPRARPRLRPRRRRPARGFWASCRRRAPPCFGSPAQQLSSVATRRQHALAACMGTGCMVPLCRFQPRLLHSVDGPVLCLPAGAGRG